MEQYIKKSALLAELKKRIRDYWSDSENTMGIYPYALEEVIKYIDSLEVKEVDLDKSLTSFMSRYAYENGGEYPSAIDIAKHFFELGMAVSNKTQERRIKYGNDNHLYCIDSFIVRYFLAYILSSYGDISPRHNRPLC